MTTNMEPTADVQQKYEQQLKQQKDLFTTASLRKGQRAQNRPTRADLEASFSPEQAAGVDQAASNGMFVVRQTVIGYPYPPCTTPLADLTPITIDELRLEEHHIGRVLFARVFGSPYRLQAVQGAIVDAAGNVDRVAVYNFEIGLKPEQVLPKHAILAIKQPYYKVTLDGGVIIRVDHPSDLLVLSEFDARAPSELRSRFPGMDLEDALSWKARGNQAFKNKDFRKAIEYYTGGLDVVQDGEDEIVKFDLYRNRAMANINLGRFEAGLVDAEAAIMPVDLHNALENNMKAFHRAGCAAYKLGNFQKAEDSFSKALNLSPIDGDALRELKRTQQRLSEQVKGEYDFEQIADSVTLHHTRLDHADYSAKVESRLSKTGGNGLFATTAISAGELILCEKAFSVAYEQDEGTEQTVIINLNRDSASCGTHATRLVATIHKMLHSPRQNDRVLSLYDGGYSPKPTNILVDGRVPVDTFQVQAALELNGFGCPPLTTVAQADTTSEGPNGQVTRGSTGAWIMAALMNHDCIGNAQRAFIGDMMIVHSTKDIAKDEEILQRYKNPDDDNAEFRKNLSQSWNFTCKCRLCIAETATPEVPRRVRIAMLKRAKDFLERNQVSQDNPPKPGVIIRAEKLRAQVANSYDGTLFKGLPRLGLHDLDHWLCMAYILSGAEKEVREAGLTVLRDQGLELTIKNNKVSILRPHCRPDVTGIHAATYVAAGYYKEGQTKVGDQLEALAEELYRIGYGTTKGYHGRLSVERDS